MKKKIRLLPMLAAILMLVSCLPAAVLADGSADEGALLLDLPVYLAGSEDITTPEYDDEDSITYGFQDGTLTISGSVGMDNYSSSVRPPWESLKDYITAIVIKDGVTGVGERAFYDFNAVESVTLPVSLKTIGKNAFDSCDKLTDVHFQGSEEDWGKITIESGNAPLNNVRFEGPEEILLATPPVGDRNTTIAPPRDGWVKGENTFTVTVAGETAYGCVVLQSNDGGKTYTRLSPTENPDGSHSFTASDVTENTLIRAMRRGDLNGDGAISSLELTQTRLALAGLTEIPALAMAAADLNGDGIISPLELTRIRLSAAGLSQIPW